mmetsp:Transcript_63566/g.176250  ORF Transcript_63566/g.176250 Transcript_63566/m.176250 type:complete len:208 (+) Transcript_63566:442-1065(+)
MQLSASEQHPQPPTTTGFEVQQGRCGARCGAPHGGRARPGTHGFHGHVEARGQTPCGRWSLKAPGQRHRRDEEALAVPAREGEAPAPRRGCGSRWQQTGGVLAAHGGPRQGTPGPAAQREKGRPRPPRAAALRPDRHATWDGSPEEAGCGCLRLPRLARGRAQRHGAGRKLGPGQRCKAEGPRLGSAAVERISAADDEALQARSVWT